MWRRLTRWQLLISFAMLSIAAAGKGKSKIQLSLQNVVDLAIHQSSSVKNAQNRYENNFWRWKNFQSQFRPQLTLNGDLPNYTQKTIPVTQEDGSVKFRQISSLNTHASLSLSQSIPQTGTNIYASSSLHRVQDLINDNIGFSGDPFVIGFTQPLFSFNRNKWSRKTEPLIYDEAQKKFVETLEGISRTATYRFFRYLKVQTNYKLAESSLSNSQDNLKIAETKKKLGTISENDFSRIKLSVLSARKALTQANMDLKNADFELKSYVGLDQHVDIELIMPLEMKLFEVDRLR